MENHFLLVLPRVQRERQTPRTKVGLVSVYVGVCGPI